MGFPRQEYWIALPCPSPGDLPNPSIEPGSPALQADHHLSHQESHDKPRHPIKKQIHHFANKGPYSQICGPYSQSSDEGEGRE